MSQKFLDIDGLSHFKDKIVALINSIDAGVTGVKGNSESTYRKGNVNITKANIGLGNVDNTSDANKPISTLTQTRLNLKRNTADLREVATSGSYNDLSDKPTIPRGSVTSVRVQATSPVTSSVSTAQTGSLNTTIALADGYGDTKNPYASKTKNYVLASGATRNGVPTFRALVRADIPTITKSKISDFPTIPTITDTYSSTSSNGMSGKAVASAITALNLSQYALKSDLTSLYKYKGSVQALANLPSTGNTTGDVYDVQSTGMNYAWNGEAWDALGQLMDISAITNTEIDALFA